MLAEPPPEASPGQRRLLSGPQSPDASAPAGSAKDKSGAAAGDAWSYAIRGNHTFLPDTRQLFNVFDVQPDPSYRDYWLFANLQLNLDR